MLLLTAEQTAGGAVVTVEIAGMELTPLELWGLLVKRLREQGGWEEGMVLGMMTGVRVGGGGAWRGGLR